MTRINPTSPYLARAFRAAALAVVLFAVAGPQPAAARPVALTYAEAAAWMQAGVPSRRMPPAHPGDDYACRYPGRRPPAPSPPPEAHRVRLVFEYDAFGRRAVKRVYRREAGDWALRDTVKFVYAGWLLIAELDAEDNLLRSYTWGRDLSGGLQGAGGIGGLMAVRDHAAGRTLWPVYDDRGNVTALVDAAEHTVLASIEYGPYGELLAVDAAPGAGIDRTNLAALCPLLFSTKYLDAELLPSGGLYYYGYRYYEPTAGKWLNRDPLAEAGGLNLYGFVGNDPFNAVDPWGLEGLPKIEIVVRQFGWNPADARAQERHQANARAFFTGRGVGGERVHVGHVFLRITPTNGDVQTFSYHPVEWPKGDNLAPWYHIRTQRDNLIDANWKRHARVWRDDPVDKELRISNTRLFHTYVSVPSQEGDPERLIAAIDAWITRTGAGFELGDHRKDERNRDNTIGDEHRPNTGDKAFYWLYGQNCGWWSVTMVRDAGLTIPEEAIGELAKYNRGVGINTRYWHNQQFVLRAEAEVRQAQQDLRDSLWELWTQRNRYDGSFFIAGPETTHPLMMDPDERTDIGLTSEASRIPAGEAKGGRQNAPQGIPRGIPRGIPKFPAH